MRVFLGTVLLCVLAGAADRTARVEGTLRDEFGNPVAGALVSLRTAAQVTAASQTTDENGRFTLVNLSPGSYLLRAQKPGFTPLSATLSLSASQTSTWSGVMPIGLVRSEITVSADIDQVQESAQSSQAVTVIPRSVIEERAFTTLTDAIDFEPGVTSVDTSPAMGAVFVRGLSGKNVSIHKDGVRYTTSAQRGGVSTFLNLNDPAHLDSIDILRGPSSARFGSDSLGGSVNLLSRSPQLASSGWRYSGDFAPFYQSAAHSYGASATLDVSSTRVGFLSNLSGRRINTLRTGAALDSHAAVTRFLGLPSSVLATRLPDTAFTNYGGTFHTQATLSPSRQLVGHYERSQQDGVKRYDQLLGGDGNLLADVRNLMLDFGYVRFQSFHPALLDQLSVTGSFNAQREERANQGGQGNPNGSITHQYEKQRAWGLSLDGSRRLSRHALSGGAEAYYERMSSPAYSLNPVTSVFTLTRPRIPDGARTWNYGVFLQDIWQSSGERLRLTGSLRFGGASFTSRAANSPIVNVKPLWPDDSLAANAVTSRAGLVYRLRPPLSLQLQYSGGFRAPNMTDLASLGLQGNGFFEASAAEVIPRGATLGDSAASSASNTGIPVARLRPEVSHNYDVGLTLTTSAVRAAITGFWSDLSRSIVSQTLMLPPGVVGEPLGDQVISQQLPSGAVFVPASPNAVQVRANYAATRMRGVEQSLRLRLSRSWSWQQNLTYIHAKDMRTDLPPDIEPGVPPLLVNSSLLFSPASRRVWVELYFTAAGRQSRLSSLALEDRRIGATRTRSTIAAFFNNGARVRGLTAGGILLPTGETLAQVQNRVLGTAVSAPLYRAIPGYAWFGLRGGFPLSDSSDVILDYSNVTDRNFRGVGSGVDAPGRSFAVRYRLRF